MQLFLRYESSWGFKQLFHFKVLSLLQALQLNHIINNEFRRASILWCTRKETTTDNNDVVYNLVSALFPCNSDTIPNNSLPIFLQIKGAICSALQAGVNVKWLLFGLLLPVLSFDHALMWFVCPEHNWLKSISRIMNVVWDAAHWGRSVWLSVARRRPKAAAASHKEKVNKVWRGYQIAT